jgi:hypothetical protein
MNRSTLAALVVALMLGSGIAGYLIGAPGEQLDRPSPPPRTASTATPAPAPAIPAVPTAPPSGSTAPTPIAQPAAAPNEPFAYRRLGIDSSRADGEACLAFNKPLATGDVKYADYVRIEPEVKSALRVVDDRLCVGGLTYGQATRSLLQGFPGRDGAKLEPNSIDVAMGARRHASGKGFILPRGSLPVCPITDQRLEGRRRRLSRQRARHRALRRRCCHLRI